MYWAASCGGCEIAVLNIHEKILDVDANFDVVFWPVAMDAKYKDVEAMEDGSILLTLFNGGIRNDENEHMAKLMRQKSKILVAFGSCACEGCIPGLANLGRLERDRSHGLQHDHDGQPATDLSRRPPTTCRRAKSTSPRSCPVLKTLDQVVDVDYYMPGCPPESHQIAAVIDLVIQVLQGKAQLPPKGAVIGAGDSTVCDECPRTRDVKSIKSFERIWAIAPEPTVCLLEQGIPCNGLPPAAAAMRCCPTAGAQCIGCYGPAEGVMDYGARLISSFASVIDSNDPKEIDRILDGLVDPVGQFYRFNLAGSLLKAGVPAWKKAKA